MEASLYFIVRERIAGRYGPMGSRMAEFAQHLLKKHEISTASRFSLLIGRRLGCRQENQTEFDPAHLSVPELESLYEEILEEDWDDVTPERQEEDVCRDKRMTVLAILKFHQFLKAVHTVGELDELKNRLNPQGLLPVDANFITIDEYRCVLSYIDGDTNLNNPYMRKALQLFVSLCFWGGLRPQRSTRPSRQRSGCCRPPSYTALCEAKTENKQRQPLPSGADIAAEGTLRRSRAMGKRTRTRSEESRGCPVLFPAG
jgi:hypothetical protein